FPTRRSSDLPSTNNMMTDIPFPSSPRRLSIYFTTVCAGVEEYRSIYYHNIQRHQRGGFAMRLFSEMNREELRREIERLEEEMRRARRNGFEAEWKSPAQRLNLANSYRTD